MSRYNTFHVNHLLLPIASLALLLAACSAEPPAGQGDTPPTETALAQDSDAGDSATETPFGAGTMDEQQRAQLEMAAAMGGGFHALGEACGMGEGGELTRLDAAQRQVVSELGGDPEAFRRRFNAVYREGRDKIAAAPKAELEQQCAQLREMQEMGEQMLREQERAGG